MIRTVLVLFWISLVLALPGPTLLLWSLVTGRAHSMYITARFTLRVALILAGVRVRFTHAPPDSATEQAVRAGGRAISAFSADRNYVFMANHVSNVDPPLCFLAIPQDLKVIFKEELLRLPILSTAFRLARCIPLDRSDSEAARRAIDQAVAQLKQGDSFLIFPEGTRSRDGRLGPFKSGGFVMAILSGTPVVPITLRSTREIQAKGAWKLNRGEVEIVFHPPIPPPLSIDQKGAFRERVRETIRRSLE
jgi:1-acyl-sn-glycerol-3-phosphate acyltransferase